MLYDQMVAVATSLLLWPLFLPVVGVPTTALAALVVVRGSNRYAASHLHRQPVSYAWVWIAWTVLAWEGFVTANALSTMLVEMNAEVLVLLGWATLWHGVQTTLIVRSLLRVRRVNLARAAI